MNRALGAFLGFLALVVGSMLVVSQAPSEAAGGAVSARGHLQGAPRVGSCYRLSSKELKKSSYGEAPVRCHKRHTSVVIAVAKLPKGTKLNPRSAAVQRAIYRSCRPAVHRVLHTSVLGAGLTAYSFGFFFPDQRQRAKGARWVRCDMILLKRGKPSRIPSKLGVGTYPFSSRVSLCLATGSLATTICSSPHTYRATAILKLKGHYPAAQSARSRIAHKCNHHVTSHHFRYGISSEQDWRHGYRLLTCYSENRH